MTTRRALAVDCRRMTDDGITLAETLVVMVIFGIIGAIVTTASVTGLRQQTKVQDRSDVLAQVRTVLQRIDRDVRSANPLLAATSTQIVLRQVLPTSSRTITYAVSNGQLVATQVTTTTAGASSTSTKVLLRNVLNTTAIPLFSVLPTTGYVAPTGSGVTASTCVMTGGSFDPGCIGTITTRVVVRPSTLTQPLTVSDNGTQLRNQR